MSTKAKHRKKLSEQEIDRTVIEQAADDVAWEKPARVRRAKSASVTNYELLITYHAEESNAQGR